MKRIIFDESVSNSMETFWKLKWSFFSRALCSPLYQPQWHWKKKLVCCLDGILWEVRHSTSGSAWACEYLLYVVHVSFEMKRILFLASILFLNGTFTENRRTTNKRPSLSELPLKWHFSILSTISRMKMARFWTFSVEFEDVEIFESVFKGQSRRFSHRIEFKISDLH